ncbi:MAG: hypothetical protein ACTHN5_22750 [Phycisphaerae bacterium]
MVKGPPPAVVEAKHELSGASSRGIWRFILCFVLTMGLIHVGLWLTLGGMNHYVGMHESLPPPIGEPRPRQLEQPLQPAPGHPTSPAQDLAEMKAEQLQRLNSYGPIKGDPGHVHIPIDRAMEMLLQSGELRKPVNGADTQPYINPTTQPSTENRT